ncbi:MAG TPA: hypothetical protein VHC63_15255 [Acidimicrobiales bacterium]|nr:hypothetical protein [Acidimicrobiales bacterium]
MARAIEAISALHREYGGDEQALGALARGLVHDLTGRIADALDDALLDLDVLAQPEVIA